MTPMKMLFPRGRFYRAPLVIAFYCCFGGRAGVASASDPTQNATELLPPKGAVLQLPPAPENPVKGAVGAGPSARPAQPLSAARGKASASSASRPVQFALPDAVTPPRAPASPRAETLSEAARRLKLSLPLTSGRIVVLKARRRLELWNGSTLVKTYRMALGDNPDGRKERKYDGRTPEGEYYICTRNSTDSHFHIFLGLSYPALDDAKRGVQSRTISWREYETIRQSLASRATPLWSTELGGWIGIHGGTNNIYAQRLIRKRGSSDWTAGCIALTDAEIEEIHAATRLGTPVVIKP
jgi:lipoprotein-anchoring transpeptidase ErfK/SrfK